MVYKKISGKIALITGANAGMGYQTALTLASRNCRVIMADKDDQTESRNEIVKVTCNENISIKHLDLASFQSVRRLAEELAEQETHLDILVNNAGVFSMENETTCDGLDAVMQINHFGPFLLTNLLAELLRKSERGRTIFVTSLGAFFHNLSLENLKEPTKISPNILSAPIKYYNSKLCNMIAAQGFAKEFKKWNISSNCLHPGMTNTTFLTKSSTGDGFLKKCLKGLTRGIVKCTTKDVDEAAQLAVFLATSDHVKHISGKYFVDYQVHSPPRVLEDEEFCKMVWNQSEIIVGINNDNKICT